ncbi:hypothetical protein HanIR_Chr03g0116261 [Helianthus annuus]|nr:hypothetical protein HanIR_Chr03g0116261 [Helianthus annuus]
MIVQKSENTHPNSSLAFLFDYLSSSSLFYENIALASHMGDWLKLTRDATTL